MIPEIVGGLAGALEPIAGEFTNLQITTFLNVNPTPPTIDIYPADPFQDGTGFDPEKPVFLFTIRARATVADNEAGQRVLHKLLEPAGPTSVQAALYADPELGGLVDDVAIENEGTSGYRLYDVPGLAGAGPLIGCEWRVRVVT